MTDELMEQRMAELNARNTEKAPAFDSEKRAYSVDDIMEILDISRSSAYNVTLDKPFDPSKILLHMLECRMTTPFWAKAVGCIQKSRLVDTL